MTGKEPTKLTLIDTPLGHTAWNMDDNNLLLVSSENEQETTGLLTRMAQQVRKMGGRAVCADTEHDWPTPGQGVDSVKPRQYELLRAYCALAHAVARVRAEQASLAYPPFVIFINHFDLMMMRVNERPTPHKTAGILHDMQQQLASIMSHTGVGVGVVLCAQKFDTGVQAATKWVFPEWLDSADRVHVDKQGHIRIEQGDVDLSLTIQDEGAAYDLLMEALMDALQRLKHTGTEEE